jgi:hypothetical protein
VFFNMKRWLIALVLLLLVWTASAAAATTAPRNKVRPAITGTARQGEMLTADTGQWTGTQPMTFGYQWRRCDTNGANCSNIISATSKTYTLTSADVGNRLRVRVRASNDAGAATATSLPTAVVAAQPPKSVRLDSSQSVVVYGGSVTLFGSVANGQPSEPVTIIERQVPSFNGVDVRAVATVETGTDGSFSVVVHPVGRTLYRASNGQTTSNTVSVNVRPRLSLARISSHRFALRATAARSFVGRYGVLQRFSRRTHHWVSVRRVSFTRAFPSASPTITSRAVFRARLGGARIRVFLRSSQASPGYIAGVSNTLTA